MYRRYRQNENSHENDKAPLINGYVRNIPLFDKPRKRKLILHFDARNTIFVADHSSRISVEQALNTYIAGVVWGIQKPEGGWECISKVPTLCTPVPGAISMYKLIERDLVKVPSDRAQLRQVLGDFTQRSDGAAFSSYFHHHLSMLEWPRKEAPNPNLTVTGLDGRHYHYLIPSFLSLVAYLHDQGLEFAVIIRTFGRDAPHIIRALRLMIEGKHPDFPRAINVPVNDNVEYLNRNRDGNDYEYLFTGPDGEEARLVNERDIYNHWNDCKGVVGVVDDFVHWQSHNYHFSAAKPLWFDPNDCDHQHIAFDDNIRVDDEDNILNLCRLEKSAQSNGKVVNGNKTLSPNEARQFQDVFFVQADLLESTANRNYFIERTRACIKRLDALLEANPKLKI